jgi:hypothetical protein
MEEKRVPTQFLDLKSQDFGPRQEDPGSRIQKVGRPPPTRLIEIILPQRMRKDDEVLADLDHTQGTISELSRRWAKQALSICLATWDSAVRAVRTGNMTVGRTVTLEREVPLRARAEDQAPSTLTMASGASIVIYPEIDAPAGWIAARAPSGELGYVAAEQVLS